MTTCRYTTDLLIASCPNSRHPHFWPSIMSLLTKSEAMCCSHTISKVLCLICLILCVIFQVQPLLSMAGSNVLGLKQRITPKSKYEKYIQATLTEAYYICIPNQSRYRSALRSWFIICFYDLFIIAQRLYNHSTRIRKKTYWQHPLTLHMFLIFEIDSL